MDDFLPGYSRGVVLVIVHGFGFAGRGPLGEALRVPALDVAAALPGIGDVPLAEEADAEHRADRDMGGTDRQAEP